MLLPAPAKAKSKALRAACINNLKRMGLTVSMYGGENRDFLAWRNWKADAGSADHALPGHAGQRVGERAGDVA